MDRNKIGQALTNILSTSFTHTPVYGNITVSVQIVHKSNVSSNNSSTTGVLMTTKSNNNNGLGEYILVVTVKDTSDIIDHVCIYIL